MNQKWTNTPEYLRSKQSSKLQENATRWQQESTYISAEIHTLNFQKIREIVVCHICIRLYQQTKTSSMFAV